MKIDAHQHFWKYQKQGFEWITDSMSAIQRDFLPADLAPHLQQNKIDGCVTVQVAQSETENEFLLGLAEESPFIKGVVGWVDFKSEKIIDHLTQLSRHKKLKGFRHIVQGEADGFLLHPDFIRGIQALKHFPFTYDILVYSRQLPDVINFLPAVAEQPLVIDHLAKPSIKTNDLKDWSRLIKEVARFENVYCKLSGMVTEADWNNWSQEDFLPYLDVALECFGSKRLMYGSDWPVCQVAATYYEQRSIVTNFIASLSTSEKDLIEGGNAVRFYNL